MSTQQSGGMSLAGVLFIVFLVLKLTDNIDWSWWWVTSPLWLGLAVIFGVAAVVGTVYAPFWIIKQRRRANFKGTHGTRPRV